MKGLTNRQKLVYSYRRYLLQYYSTGPGSKLAKSQRFYDIVNQTDPEELFKHLSDESLIQKITQDAVSKKPPDDAIFNRQRTIIGAHLHHESELERNRQAVPSEWDDIEIYEFHQELKDIKERIGSAPESLAELREVDHDPKGVDRTPESVARSAHPLGTKSAAGPLEYDPNNVLSPKARAGEVYLMNLPDKDRIRAIEMDPERDSFKAFEEGQRINQEMGLPPQERRTARPGRTGSALTSQANYEKYATPELVEATGIPVKGKRRAAKALAVAGLTGISWAGLPASAAETVIRADIATTTNDPADYLQLGLSGISNLADVLPIFGELLSTPADAANWYIDERRDPDSSYNKPPVPKENLVPGAMGMMYDPDQEPVELPSAGEIVQGTVNTVQQGLGALESLYQKAKDKLPSITLGGYSGF
jgi:hypothetical protein